MPTRARQSSSLLSPKKAPAKRAAPRPEPSLEEQLLAADLPELPAFPDTPAPVPEGEVLGLPDAPEGATEAAPITEELAVSGETPVDPTTGQEAFVPQTTVAGKSDDLKAELAAAEAKRQAALHAAGKLPAPQVRSAGTPVVPMTTTPRTDHEAAQRDYKAHMAQLRRTPAGTTVVEPDIEASLDTETAEEALRREHAEAKARYEARVAAMSPDEPRYVATGRAPRPKVEGYVLHPGDVVPGAYLFTRLESWLNAKTIAPA